MKPTVSFSRAIEENRKKVKRSVIGLIRQGWIYNTHTKVAEPFCAECDKRGIGRCLHQFEFVKVYFYK